jgi:hypothetical protein
MRKKNVSLEGELSFIRDTELRRTIEDAIQYIYIIFDQARRSDNSLYKEETYRVIVLYVVSVMEALLLYTLKSLDKKITYCDYKYVSLLPPELTHTERPGDPLIIAVQTECVKHNSAIRFVELVEYMKNINFLEKDLVKDLLHINDIRNTFHFTKPRDQITNEVDTVEKSLDLLLKVIQKSSIS